MDAETSREKSVVILHEEDERSTSFYSIRFSLQGQETAFNAVQKDNSRICL